jgi:hypothetical protein
LQSLVAESFFDPNSYVAAFASSFAKQYMLSALAVSVYQVICTIKGFSFT